MGSRPVRRVPFGSPAMSVELRPDGAILLRHPEPLGPYPARLTERLMHWAAKAPDRPFLAQRRSAVPADGWRELRFGEALDKARALGQALLDRGLSAERPLMILSDNDIEHGLLALAAPHVGIPYAPVSSAYSLISTDFSKLRYITGLLTPGLVFAASGARFARAIEAVIPTDVEVVVADAPLPGRRCTSFSELLATRPGDAVDRAHAAVGPDTIAKFLFTSGSTGQPKGVITTHGMLSANQQMIIQSLPSLGIEPPVLVEWAPWNHTAGGSHNFNLALYNGGTLHIDEGRPLPALIERTVQNLREIAPTWYFNVPRGFEALLPYMRIGPAPAIRAVVERAGLSIADIDRFEINEAFGAQCLAVERELGLDHAKVNVNGGAIAIGHPLAATGVRLTVTVARELQRRDLRWGISTACVGGGQGIALLIENAASCG